MSKESEEIRKALIAIVKGSNSVVAEWCRVKSITGKSCTVDVDGLAIDKIALGFDDSGVTVYPKENTDVLVLFASNTNNVGVVIWAKETDKIEIMGNGNGGLIKIDDLKQQYDNNLEAIKASCVAGFTALAGLDGSASLNAFNTAKNSILALDKTALENDKIKHG
jgi:hypothetical protein